MGPPISTSLIIDTLRELNERVSVPLWLFGGVAVDFLVGRWTRPHSDIDLNTYAESRDALSPDELSRIGYVVPSIQVGLRMGGKRGLAGVLRWCFLDRC